MNINNIAVVLFVITFFHGAKGMQDEIDLPSSPQLSPVLRALSPLGCSSLPIPAELQVWGAYRQLLNKFTSVQKQQSTNVCSYNELVDLSNEAAQLAKEAQDMQVELYENRIAHLKRRINQYIKDLFPQSPQQQRRRRN